MTYCIYVCIYIYIFFLFIFFILRKVAVAARNAFCEWTRVCGGSGGGGGTFLRLPSYLRIPSAPRAPLRKLQLNPLFYTTKILQLNPSRTLDVFLYYLFYTLDVIYNTYNCDINFLPLYQNLTIFENINTDFLNCRPLKTTRNFRKMVN